eukprot:7877277-Alexandrium_andersonii.AAC.1
MHNCRQASAFRSGQQRRLLTSRLSPPSAPPPLRARGRIGGCGAMGWWGCGGLARNRSCLLYTSPSPRD